jgi:hypothetical protein
MAKQVLELLLIIDTVLRLFCYNEKVSAILLTHTAIVSSV